MTMTITPIDVDELYPDDDLRPSTLRSPGVALLPPPLLELFRTISAGGGGLHFCRSVGQRINGGSDRRCYRPAGRVCEPMESCRTEIRESLLTVWSSTGQGWGLRGGVWTYRNQCGRVRTFGNGGTYGPGVARVAGANYIGYTIANLLGSLLPSLLAQDMANRELGHHPLQDDRPWWPDEDGQIRPVD